jgi:hypothetical protein
MTDRFKILSDRTTYSWHGTPTTVTGNCGFTLAKKAMAELPDEERCKILRGNALRMHELPYELST